MSFVLSKNTQVLVPTTRGDGKEVGCSQGTFVCLCLLSGIKNKFTILRTTLHNSLAKWTKMQPCVAGLNTGDTAKNRLLLASHWRLANYKVSVPIITVGPLSSICCAHVYVRIRQLTCMNGNKRPTAKLDSQFTVPAIMKAAGRLACSNSSPVRMKGIPPDTDKTGGYLWIYPPCVLINPERLLHEDHQQSLIGHRAHVEITFQFFGLFFSLISPFCVFDKWCEISYW